LQLNNGGWEVFKFKVTTFCASIKRREKSQKDLYGLGLLDGKREKIKAVINKGPLLSSLSSSF